MPEKGKGDHTVASGFNFRVVATERNVSVMHTAPGTIRISIANADLIEPGVWWVARVKVDDASQGKGIGSALCAAMKAACAEMGATQVQVCPGGYDGNTKRQAAFYHRNGFEFVDESMMVWRPRA